MCSFLLSGIRRIVLILVGGFAAQLVHASMLAHRFDKDSLRFVLFMGLNYYLS